MNFRSPWGEARHEFVGGPLDTEMLTPPKANGELADKLYWGKPGPPGHYSGLKLDPTESRTTAYYHLSPDPDSPLKSKYIWTRA